MRWKATQNIPWIGIIKGMSYDLNREFLEQINKASGRIRATGDERNAFEHLEAAGSIICQNTEKMKRLGRHRLNDGTHGQGYKFLKAAEYFMTRALGELSASMDLKQIISMQENSKDWKIAIGNSPIPLAINVPAHEIGQIVDAAQQAHCSSAKCKECTHASKWRDCDLYKALEVMPVSIKEIDENSGRLCPYMLQDWVGQEEMQI